MNKRPYTILLAINQPLTEAGIVTFLAESPEFKILEGIDGSGDLIEAIMAKNPDLLIVDYNSPGFISLDDLQYIITNASHLNTLIISSDDNKGNILKAVQLGIKGYLTKDCGRNEFLLAVQSTAKGEKFFCSKILDIILEPHLPEREDENSTLTIREKEVLKFLAQGHSTQKIADTLHLSPHTVQTHRKSIIRKLKIKSPTQFVIYALDMGLITQQ